MISFLVYEESTGRILKTGSTTAESLSLQAKNSGELVMEGLASDENHYVKDGEIIDKGQQPSEGHVFNYTTEQWELDIDLARSKKWKAIKLARQAQELSTFEWNTRTFQCDEVSQMRIQSAVQAAIIDDGLNMIWTLADNSTQTFNATEVKQIGRALANHVNTCHERGRILRAEIQSATTQEELEAITW
jgi:DUF1365 family protein